MKTTKLTFDPTGWLEINYTQTIQLPDVVTPEVPAVLDAENNEVTPAVPEHTVPGEVQQVVLQCTSYHPTQLKLIQADCATHGVPVPMSEVIGADDDGNPITVALWVADYVPPPPPVLTSAARWAAIKAIRDKKTQTGGYKVGVNWYHSDTFSRTQQMGLVMMGAGLPTGLQWKTMGGNFVPMTPTLAQQIFAAAAQQDSALFAHAEALKADAAADIEAGWPATFQG